MKISPIRLFLLLGGFFFCLALAVPAQAGTRLVAALADNVPTLDGLWKGQL